MATQKGREQVASGLLLPVPAVGGGDEVGEGGQREELLEGGAPVGLAGQKTR